MINLKDKKILVLGFARSGYSTAKILNKLGYDVTLNAYDDLSTDEKAAELRELGVKVINLDNNLCVGFIPLKTKTEETLFKALAAQG